MFGPLGVPELLLIFAVILVVFGPRRIPEIGRTLGKALSEFRKATDDLKGTIEREVRLEELKKIGPDIVTPFESISRTEPSPGPLGGFSGDQAATEAAQPADPAPGDETIPRGEVPAGRALIEETPAPAASGASESATDDPATTR